MTQTIFTGLLAATLLLAGCAAAPGKGGQGGEAGEPSSQSQESGGGSGSSGTGEAGSQAPDPIVIAKNPGGGSGSDGAPTGGSASPEKPNGSSSTRQAGTTGAPGSAVPPTAQTPEERRGAIDRRLDDTLGTFDEELKREQEQVARERDQQAASRSGSASSDEENAEEGDSEGDDEPGSADAEGLPAEGDGEGKDGDKRPGDLKSEKQTRKTAGAGSNSDNGSAAANVPDGSDDDIVARRLRKAAEQETDPELKAKLWKEYIEYKKNTK
jgi:hypothetical protein